jgi:hypothetical protein
VQSKAAFELEVDVARNRVLTRYLGNVTAAHMAAGLAQAEKLLPQMPAGFAVLADLRELEAMDLDCAPPLAKIMDLCKAHGVGLVVRVMPDLTKDIGLNILSLIHYRGEVQIITCDTMEEAERALQS